jgi:chromosome segregation ATPase
MAKDLEYFKDFLDNPGSYKVKEFYEYIREWVKYVTEHKDEFNYLEDEEWREIKERVLEALEIKEDLRDEFEELEERLDAVHELETEAEKLEVYREWLEFMKKNQAEYAFTDEQISKTEAQLHKLTLSILDCEASQERLKRSRKEYQESLEELDDSIFEHYVRTGKRPVLSALQFKFGKRLKGN